MYKDYNGVSLQVGDLVELIGWSYRSPSSRLNIITGFNDTTAEMCGLNPYVPNDGINASYLRFTSRSNFYKLVVDV